MKSHVVFTQENMRNDAHVQLNISLYYAPILLGMLCIGQFLGQDTRNSVPR